MARFNNAITFGNAFNIATNAPIDSRMRVEHVTDLTSSETWPDDKAPLYNGMIVVVTDTSDIWVLKDADNYNDLDLGWTKIGHLEEGHGIIISGNTVSVDPDVIRQDLIDDETISTEKTYSSEKIMKIINGVSFAVKIVDELPESGDPRTIYFVPKEQDELHVSGETNAYDEYIYVEEEEGGEWKWEKIGDTELDLSDYYTKEETDAIADGILDYVDSGLTYLDSGLTELAGLLYELSGSVEDINSALDNKIDALSGAVETITNEISSDLNELSGSVITFSGSVVALEENLDEIHQTISSNINELSGKIDNLEETKQDNLSAGSGITIVSNVVNANTEANTVSDINISNSAPIDARGVWKNNVIPSGTSVQEILEKLLFREVYPNAATKPSITNVTTDGNKGVFILGTEITIGTPTTQTSNGKYNAKYNDPQQPTNYTVTWGADNIVESEITGFTNGSEGKRVVVLGENKIVYTVSKTYSEPGVHYPLTNLGNETRSTSSVSTATTEYSAIWENGTAIVTGKTVSAIGVYPCFTNINGSALTLDEKSSMCDLVTGDTITIVNIPSEITSGEIHFSFAFPDDRKVEFLVKTLEVNEDGSPKFVPYDSAYTISGSKPNFFGNISYKVLSTTGEIYQGQSTYRFVLSKKLSE